MGWWDTDAEGHSFVHGVRMSPLHNGPVWGDDPADVMGPALQEITHQFITAWGRPPTQEELCAGVKFSYRAMEADGRN
jgi:hypothetical protein